MMEQRYWSRIPLSVVVIASLVLAACAPASTPVARQAQPASPTAAGKQHSDEAAAATKTHADEAAAAGREIVVKANEWSFAPASIQLTAGQPVRLLLENEGKTLHDIAFVGLDAEVHEAAEHSEGEKHGEAKAGHAEGADHDTGGAKVHVNAEPGETGVVEFTPAESGAFEFICTLPGHKQAGMIGKLHVEPGAQAGHPKVAD